MSEQDLTPFSNRCDILGDLWIEFKTDPDFADFIQYNDLGLPLAYAVSTDIISVTPKAEAYINETFDLLLEAMGLKDEGFDSLTDIIIRDNG